MDYISLIASTEEAPEIVEEILEHNMDDVYRVLAGISDKLSDISVQMDELKETSAGILQVLQSSFLDTIAAFLLILVGFEIMRLVRGWIKGGRNNGHTN